MYSSHVLALLLGVKMNWDPSALLGVLVTVILGAAMFSTVSLIIASGQDSRTIHEHGAGAYHAAIFRQQRDLSDLADATWLQIISHINPLTYEVDALRMRA